VRRTSSIVTVVLLFAVAGAACSREDTRDVTAVRAVAATEAARAFRVEGESTTWDVADLKHPVSSSHSEGEVDLSAERLHVTSTLMPTDAPDSGEQTIEIIQIGRDVWTKFSLPDPDHLGGEITIVGSEKPWQHHRSGSAPPTTGFDPVAMLDRLRSQGSRLSAQGDEEVRGVSTTHYRVSHGETTSSISDFDVEGVTTDVWLDDDEVVRRIEHVYEFESDHDDPALRTVARMEIFDLGASLQIEPPPADLVGESPDWSEEPSTTTTVFRPRHPGNELLTFQAVRGTAPAPCEPTALPTSDVSECLTVSDVPWTRPVVEAAEASEVAPGQWAVRVILTEQAIEQFNELAAECFARSSSCLTGRVAVILNRTALSAPTIESPSFERDQIEISGNFSESEAKDLVSRMT
jgi:hypothetical protein